VSSTLKVFRVVLKERYKSPTLELIVPAMIAGNVMIPAFLIRGGFQPYGLVLSFIPMINVSETAAIALALRNVIFVTGEHVHQGFVSSYLTMPVSRTSFFLMTMVSDVVIPLFVFLAIETVYLDLAGILNPYSSSMLIIFSAGYLFSTGVIYLTTFLLKSPGASVLTSIFFLSAIFVGGGVGEFGLLISRNLNFLPLVSWTNPYVIAVAETLLPSRYFGALTNALTLGVLIDLILGALLYVITLLYFRRMDL
jgi:hypothetical protein